jgi:hypothetical protein
MHDWGSESAIDPINTLVYIQASNRESANLLPLIEDTPHCYPNGTHNCLNYYTMMWEKDNGEYY